MDKTKQDGAEKTIPEGYMLDSRGALMPIALVAPIDKLRDDLVRRIVRESLEYSKILSDFKRRVMDDIEAFITLSAEQYNTKIGGTKGNVQLLSYDGQYKVLRAISERITFDERLKIAEKLIEECTTSWTGNVRDEVKVLVKHAFQVDKEGKINTARVLELRRLDIQDPTWRKAMEAISDSIQISGSQSYVRVYRKNSVDKFEQINLDLAAL